MQRWCRLRVCLRMILKTLFHLKEIIRRQGCSNGLRERLSNTSFDRKVCESINLKPATQRHLHHCEGPNPVPNGTIFICVWLTLCVCFYLLLLLPLARTHTPSSAKQTKHSEWISNRITTGLPEQWCDSNDDDDSRPNGGTILVNKYGNELQ